MAAYYHYELTHYQLARMPEDTWQRLREHLERLRDWSETTEIWAEGMRDVDVIEGVGLPGADRNVASILADIHELVVGGVSIKSDTSESTTTG